MKEGVLADADGIQMLWLLQADSGMISEKFLYHIWRLIYPEATLCEVNYSKKDVLIERALLFQQKSRQDWGQPWGPVWKRTKEGLLVVWLQSSSFRGNQREGKHQKTARWIDLTRMGIKSKDINMHGSNITLLKIIPRWPLVLTTCYYFSWSEYYADQILTNS